MKIKFCIGSMIITAMILFAAPSHAALVDSLVAHWEFDETSGSTAYDSRKDHDGTIYNATMAVAGKFGTAFSFDGDGDYVGVPSTSDLQFSDGESFSVVAWINPGTQTSHSSTRIINNRGSGGGGEYAGWQLKIGDESLAGEGKWAFWGTAIDDASGNFKTCHGLGGRYDLNDWHHVAMVYYSDDKFVVYVNGQVDATVSIGIYGSLENTLPTAIGASVAYQGVEGARIDQFFTGVIDEIGIWDRALSLADIEYLQSNPIPEPASMLFALAGLGFALKRRRRS